MTAVFSARRRWRLAAIVPTLAALLLVAAYVAITTAYPPARLAAMLGEQVKAATGRDFRVNGALSIRLLPSIAVVANDVALGNAGWGSRPAMVTMRRAAFEVALRPLLEGRIHVLSVAVEGVDALFETDERGRGNWLLAPPEKPKQGVEPAARAASAPQIGLDHLLVSAALFIYRDGRSGVARTAAIDKLDVRAKDDRDAISATLEFEHQRWKVEGQVGRFEALTAGVADWPFDLRLTTDGATLAATGSVGAGPHAGTVRAEVSAHIGTAAALGPLAAPASAVPMPVDVAATLLRTADALSADPLRVALAGQALTGRVTVHGTGKQRSVDAQLAAPTLDVAKWFVDKRAAAAPSRPAAAPKGGTSLLGDTKLPFDALPSLPIRLALQVGRLNLPGVPPLSAVEARLTCEPGRFVIESLSFGAAGGRLSGRVEITVHEGAPPKIVLRLDARDLSVEALDALKGPGGHFRGGRADLKASLALAGTTPRQLAASASGDLLLSVSRTALAGKAGVLERNVLATLLEALLPGRAAHQALTIDCAVVHLPLQRGVATIDRSIAMETDQLAVSASGNVNLATQTMTLAFRPKVRKGLGLNPSSLVQLVMLKGPLQDPAIGIDAKGAAREAATVGVAVATGGLSLLGARLLDKPEESQACRRAMVGSAASQ